MVTVAVCKRFLDSFEEDSDMCTIAPGVGTRESDKKNHEELGTMCTISRRLLAADAGHEPGRALTAGLNSRGSGNGPGTPAAPAGLSGLGASPYIKTKKFSRLGFTGFFSTRILLQFHRIFLEFCSRLFAGALRAALHPYPRIIKMDLLTRLHGIGTVPANRATVQTTGLRPPS